MSISEISSQIIIQSSSATLLGVVLDEAFNSFFESMHVDGSNLPKVIVEIGAQAAVGAVLSWNLLDWIDLRGYGPPQNIGNVDFHIFFWATQRHMLSRMANVQALLKRYVRQYVNFDTVVGAVNNASQSNSVPNPAPSDPYTEFNGLE